MKSKFVIRLTESRFVGKYGSPVEYSRSRTFPTFPSAMSELNHLKSRNPDNGMIQNGRVCQMF